MFRTLGKSKIAFVLAILFGISLLFFKSGSRYSNFFNSDSVVAKVSDTIISTTKFNRVMQMNINNFNQMLNKKMTGDEIRGFQIHNMALKALINDAVFEDEFNNLNFKIDEKIIALKTKEKIPQLYDSNNNLNESNLSTFLQQQQLKIEDLVQIISYETRDEFFTNTFFNINYPSHFSDKINNFDSHKRKIKYLEIELDKISDKKILDKYSISLDSELDDYYNENIDKYMTKEKRDIEYILIDKSIIDKNTVIDSLRIKEYYNNNKKTFLKNEKRSFIQFNFKTEVDANNFANVIKVMNLDEIIKYAEDNNIRFNDFKELEENEILNQISEPLFNLEINEKSKIIKSSLANHVLILKSITPSYQLSLSESENEIKSMIKKIQTNNKFNDMINDISGSIINGSNIKEISNFHKLNIQILKNISRNFNDFKKTKEKLFLKLIESSFAANKDFVSNIIKVDDNLSLVFNVTNIEKSVPKNYVEVKDDIFEDWKRIKIIEQTKDNVTKNQNNKMFIENLSIEYEAIPVNIEISKSNNQLPINVLNKIFDSDINKNIHELYENTFFIVMINDIIIPKDNIEKELISLSSDLRNSFGNEIMKNKKISTNENLINAIIEQY